MLLVLLALSVLCAPAMATSLAKKSEETLEPGVVLTKYRASSPSTDVWVLTVDLCADGVYVDATRAPDDTATVGSWGGTVDATAATNGDFYKTGPVRVYGDAVGGGVRWPIEQTGLDSSVAGEWWWENYGWIAFRHDGVEVNHTGWVKENVSGLTEGWENADLQPDPPEGTLALVSGFPELVVEGKVMTCADPEANDCFPDRSDMRDRHPRTAMGLTQDRGTLFLVVADGRTNSNDGLYGSELAEILGQLGAWTAFNLDGGGSSELWTDGDGYVNDTEGNNYGSATRAVANHWGVYGGGRSWLPDRPGHCSSAPACAVLPAEGGVLDDAGPCFRGFGDQDYWRPVSTTGYGGSLRWTNAFKSSQPDNWAWYQVNLAEAGEYEVSYWADPTYSVHDDVNLAVHAAGATQTLEIDPSDADGWVVLGTYPFAAGGEQWVAQYDDETKDPGSDQHITADAIQLRRVGDWCGDGTCADGERCVCADCPVTDEVTANGLDDDCDGAVDEAPGGDPGLGADSGAAAEDPGPPGAATLLSSLGCECGATSPRGSGLVAVLLGLAAVARRPPAGMIGAPGGTARRQVRARSRVDIPA